MRDLVLHDAPADARRGWKKWAARPGLRLLLALGVLAGPSVFTLLLVYGYARADLRDFIPYYSMNDDLYYWEQINTFRAVGWQGGYFAGRELPAPADFAHFDAHGPFFPMIVGTLGRLAGWQPYSPPIFNLCCLTLALAALLAVLRPDLGQLVALGIVIATTWPVLFYILSGMQESFQQGIAILLAALFWIAFRRRAALPRWARVVVVGILFAAALVRLTWIFLALPFLLLVHQPITRRAAVGALITTLLLVAAAAALTLGYLYAPYQGSYLRSLQIGVSDTLRADGPLAALREGLALQIEHLGENAEKFNIGFGLEIGQRYQMVFLIAVCAAWGWWARRRADRAAPGDTTRLEAAFHLYNLGFLFVFNWAFYDMSAARDYRVMASHLLLSALLLVACRRYRVLALLVASSLLLIIPFKNQVLANAKTYLGHDHAAVEQFRQDIAGKIVYDPAESNAWCNTLAIRYHQSYAPPLVALPAGIGLSYDPASGPSSGPLKSRYVLLKPVDYEVFRTTTRLERIGSTALGDLYLNRDARCTDAPG